MDPISAVIITLNEERNIERCIASLQGVAEDIVVVDAASSDRTAAIAERLGARVFNREWTDYFDQKNFANGQALYGNILSMDADEALSPKLKEEISAHKEKGLFGAYRIPRLTNYCGTWVRHGGWYPDTKVRLFPRNAATWAGTHVHESLVLEDSLLITDLNGDLLHYSYHTLADHRERIERYSTLHAQRMFAAGRKAGFVKLQLSPIVKFVQGYFFQLGFLDGRAGYNIARFSARAVRMKYQKLNALQRNAPVEVA